MAKTRLIGDDGYVCIGELATALVGDAIDDLDDLVGGGVGSGKGFYQVTAIASSLSVFDWTGAKVGDYFWNDGTLVMATGDTARRLPATADASIKSWQISPTRAKVDLSTFVDSVNTYRMGKADVSGSITGIITVDQNLLSDRFVERMEVASDGSFTVHRVTDDPFYVVLFLQGEEASGEKLIALVGQVEAENFNFNVQDGSAQEFTCNIAPTAGDKLMKVVVALA